jgi:chorismate mutase/prephenate dehydratase
MTVESGGSAPARNDAVESALARLREQIDAVDRALLADLNERARLVTAVGELKRETGTAVYEAARERTIVERLSAANDGPFPDAGLAPVFREIISATRSLEEVLQVAYFGPEGTFAHLAARRNFGGLAELQGMPSIGDVFAAVERGKASLGVVPVENTTEGIVTATYDGLAASSLKICGEVLLRISQCLFSQSGRREDVRRVASHPQALAQCRGWLDRNLPGVERIETASTATGALAAVNAPEVAAIGSEIAAEVYGLEPIEHGIEDRCDNTTRFLVIGAADAPTPSGDDLTSVVFTIRKDESGALHRLLEPFASGTVNLTSIQLRPLDGKPWEYLFFLDVQGHHAEPEVAEALAAAARVAHSHRVLGSFPRATAPVRGAP